MARRRRREPEWADWPDDALLDLRFRDLRIAVPGTRVAAYVEEVALELAARRIRFRPHVWFSDEWFTPDGVPGIALPFYLAHPRLARLEWNQMMEVEGGSRSACMRILRHEVGHALDNAYQLRRRGRRRFVFGDPQRRYPDTYIPRPTSRNYVLHLDSWYAQSHPDEDFAETFAVWLGSGSTWRARYAGWPALRKLEFMDELMRSLAGKRPLKTDRRRYEPVSELGTTLREHYEEKRSRYAYDVADVYDDDLHRVFSADLVHRGKGTAAGFLLRNRARLRGIVARSTGRHAYTVDQILKSVALRCRELKLRLTGPASVAMLDAIAMLTVHTMHYVERGRQRFAL